MSSMSAYGSRVTRLVQTFSRQDREDPEEERQMLNNDAETSQSDLGEDMPPLNPGTKGWTSMHSTQHTFVPSLEGLRGIAVLMTQISHAWNKSVAGRHVLGPMGVDIFFVLSGFLITGVLLRHQTGTGRISYRFLLPFYTDRAVRLVPALTLMVVGIGLIKLLLGLNTANHFWYSFLALFYLYNFSSLRIKGGWGPFGNTWSLAVEEHFYIFWSLVIPFIHRFSVKKRAFALATLMSLSFALRLATSMYPGTFFGLHHYFSSLPNFWKMFLGASLQLLPIPTLFFARRFAYIGLLGFITILLYAQYAPQPHYGAIAPGWKGDFAGRLIWSDVTSCLYAMMIITSVHGEKGGNFLLENRCIRFVGKISYAWYLWQMPILAIFGGYQSNSAKGWGNTSTALVAAMISTFLVEAPISEKYKAWKEKRKSLPEYM